VSTLTERMDRLELDLRRMQRELETLRREARAAAPSAARATPEPATPGRRGADTAACAVAPSAPRPPRVDLGELLARFDLLGARGLAVAGGAVTALGITLLSVLAAERGWIGPAERVAAGALVSAPKIFLFDLAELSSVARAASFVAVGGLLLAGGVLVQRLGQPEVDILER
jgi:uncharacterized membrane protein